MYCSQRDNESEKDIHRAEGMIISESKHIWRKIMLNAKH